MKRIIQGYQEGGSVVAQPAVATGIPQGGNAATAIAEYMLGTLAGPLSYQGGTQGVPDYLALAAEQKVIREEEIARKKAEEAAAAAAAAASAAAAATYQATSSSKGSNKGSTAADVQAYHHGGGHKPATGFAHGGGADGVGNFGKVGDFFGGISDSMGITNYKDKKSSFDTPSGARNMGGPIGYNMGTLSGPVGYNTGGVSVAQSRLSEDERMRQSQMRTPQIVQPMARQPQQKGPLSNIGTQLATGAMMKGADAGVTSLMGKLGTMMGGAGAAGAATGAATAGAGAAAAGGAGLMAAAAPILGPLVIGFGLGKAFGLFNEGGKVPCSCGKTPCKCKKVMKSPLSGE